MAPSVRQVSLGLQPVSCLPSNAQNLFKKMAESGAGQPKRMSLESGRMSFHYIISSNVCFLTLAEKVGRPDTLSNPA